MNAISKVAWIKCLIAIVVTLLFFSFYNDQAGQYLINNINLIFHEAGHTLFRWTPEIFYIAAGSLFQIALPTVFVAYFVIRQQFYSASFLGFWVATNFLGVARYAADGDVMQLPLLGGDSVVHDWNYILGYYGLLGSATTVGMVISSLGVLIALASMVGMLYFSFVEPKNISNIPRW